MALDDFFTNFHLLIRWVHVIAGILWIGHLYFFNFVNAQIQPLLNDEGKKIVNPLLMPRALWWFRMGAMLTFLAGWVMFTMLYMYTPGQGFGPSPLFMGENGITDRAVWILFGMTLGSIMWFNVWFVIWPAQKKILSKQVTGDAAAVLRTRAALFSKINTYLSGPMLFGMIAPQNYAAINRVTVGVIILISAASIFHFYKISKKAGSSI